MTLADLNAIAREQEQARVRWSKDLLLKTSAKIADAHAHAAKAVADAAKGDEEDRRAVHFAVKHPSFQAALARLDELLDYLAGPSNTSMEGQIRDAREEFYRQAFGSHRELVPPELLASPDPAPTPLSIQMARGAMVHGYDPRQELLAPIEAAKQSLKASVGRAGLSTVAQREGADMLAGWRERTEAAINRTVLSLLSDSVEYCDGEARGDLIHPSFRAD